MSCANVAFEVSKSFLVGLFHLHPWLGISFFFVPSQLFLQYVRCSDKVISFVVVFELQERMCDPAWLDTWSELDPLTFLW